MERRNFNPLNLLPTRARTALPVGRAARNPLDVPPLTYEAPETDPNRQSMLLALHFRGRHVYGGTVPTKEVARRRAANKRARKARRAAR